MGIDPVSEPYYSAFRGSFSGMVTWEQLDELWQVVHSRADAGWYLYAVGEQVCTKPAERAEVERFVTEIDALLRREHEEDYCGIVYVDNKSAPTFIKIFDPNNLGVQCGFSDNPPLPGWIMSLIPPVDLPAQRAQAANRRRWWQKLWA